MSVEERSPGSAIADYLAWLRAELGLSFDDYDALWRWSVSDLNAFWMSIWRYFEVQSDGQPVAALIDAQMPGAAWFPDVRLNYAERALATAGPAIAVVARSQTTASRELTWDELRDLVARCRAGLRRLGVEEGDRVAGYLPNGIEALVAMLATVSLGAVWASCPPEFGVDGVLDRLCPLEPKVLLATDGYRYGDKVVDRRDDVVTIGEALRGSAVVHVPHLGEAPVATLSWDVLLAGREPLEFARVPFDHPLVVLFSSGTTGPPKAIVHGHGGILLEHLKLLALHQDLGPDDRFMWFTTTGWMMWNVLVSGLCIGCSIVLFDGDPGHPDLRMLWDLADELAVTGFGVSAPYLFACHKAGLELRRDRLGALRWVGSTGAPLPASAYAWVRRQLPWARVTSVSGGTDVCTAFVGEVPLLPVVGGRMGCRLLGARVEALDDVGRPTIGRRGELALTAPMPSMPVRFWGDDGTRYRDSYFTGKPGIWYHGDWITIAPDGSCEITGRSDATLNRGGVRLGTAELYSVIDGLPDVVDSIVVHLDHGGRDELVLLVQLLDGVRLDDAWRVRLAGELRTKLSPRHVPDVVHQVTAVPRTHSGKKLEVPVKRILSGGSPDDVLSRGSVAEPRAIDEVIALARMRSTSMS